MIKQGLRPTRDLAVSIIKELEKAQQIVVLQPLQPPGFKTGFARRLFQQNVVSHTPFEICVCGARGNEQCFKEVRKGVARVGFNPKVFPS